VTLLKFSEEKTRTLRFLLNHARLSSSSFHEPPPITFSIKTMKMRLFVTLSLIVSSVAFVVTPPAPTFNIVQLQASATLQASSADLQVNTYVRCGKCQTAYALSESDLGGRGRRLECSVCNHSWFQTKDRIMSVRDGYEMVPLPQTDLDRIAANIEQGKSPKFMGEAKLYVGNIAFECHEDDLYQVFSDYGVGDVSLVRDEEGKNRGFGFVVLRTKQDGERAMKELDGIAVRGRNIAVRESNN
jgi:predicted Zn finger-like uncharacterized protein